MWARCRRNDATRRRRRSTSAASWPATILRTLDGKPDADISYYGANQLMSFLRDPVIRGIPPSSIGQPAPVRCQPAAAASAAGTAGGVPDGTADPVHRRTPRQVSRTLCGSKSEWLSPPDLPYMQFRVGGDPIQNGITLSLVQRAG